MTFLPVANNCVKRFKELIQFANITDVFRDLLEYEFNMYCDYEAGGLNDDLSQVRSLLDLSVPDSGGIFDSVRAKEIERLAYLKSPDTNFFYKLVTDPNGYDSDWKERSWKEHTVKTVLRWRNEYIVKYKDEP